MNHVEVYETHLVTSEDGYINTVFRIPHPNPRGVIALMHPVTVDATIYLGQSNESFGNYSSFLVQLTKRVQYQLITCRIWATTCGCPTIVERSTPIGT